MASICSSLHKVWSRYLRPAVTLTVTWSGTDVFIRAGSLLPYSYSAQTLVLRDAYSTHEKLYKNSDWHCFLKPASKKRDQLVSCWLTAECDIALYPCIIRQLSEVTFCHMQVWTMCEIWQAAPSLELTPMSFLMCAISTMVSTVQFLTKTYWHPKMKAIWIL